MNQEKRDRELGMGRRITRRDFLNGVAVGIGALGPHCPNWLQAPPQVRVILQRDLTPRRSRV